jgi:hypothetical protein
MTHRTGCAALRHTTAGQSKPWQYRPSDHLHGNRRHVFGPILPMRQASWLERLFGRA